jgi:hypothetical protein
LLRRGALYEEQRVHGKEVCMLLWEFCLRRGAPRLSAHPSLEGGTLERRAQDQGQGKGKESFC